jgi:hypothetical protein
MPSIDFNDDPLSQREKHLIMENDAKVRAGLSLVSTDPNREASTYFEQARIEALHEGGRLARMSQPTFVGATPGWARPRASGMQDDPVGQEPPLGIDVNAVEPVGTECMSEPGFGDRLEAAIRERRTILGTPSPSIQPGDGTAPPSSGSGAAFRRRI